MIAIAALKANQPEFEFQAGPHSAGELAVIGFEAQEVLSQLYSVEVHLAAPPTVPVDEKSLIGTNAQLTVHLGDGSARFFHGIVSRVARWDAGRTPERQRYRITVVPRLWKLRHTRRSRIFQEMTVPEIVHKVLGESQVQHTLMLQGSYAQREYCVQYRESDLNFVSRLLEEEGIYYYFEHADGAHTMMIGDASITCPAIEGDASLVFREPSRMVAGSESVHEFSARREIQPGAVVLRDFHFVRPSLDLTAISTDDQGEHALEIYDYPARYEQPGIGRSLAKVRLEELRAQVATGAGASNCRRLLVGHTFNLVEHPVDELNHHYLLLSVRHTGRQPEVLTVEQTMAESREPYRNEFLCMPAEVPFRPPRTAPRPLIAGAQTAMVVGPPGEEIHTDKHGRIKVQFHWDREGKRNDRSSCWIRVSQVWAGQGWGTLCLPRIGHEVVVEFLEGDPDRPLITGSVYNGQNPPPIWLPDDKTQSTLRSSSSLGGNGSNELRFEDRASQEQVYLHAQKDFNIIVENDKTQEVRGNETLLVKKDRTKTVEGNQLLQVQKNDDSVIDGNQTLEVLQDRSTAVTGNHTEHVVGNQSISVDSSQTVTVAMASAETVGLGKMLNVGGAYAITVGAALNQMIGGIMAEEVGGSKTETVGAMKSETVMGSRSLQVGGGLSEQIGLNRSLQVGKDLLLTVGGTHTHVVKEDYTLSAKEISLVAEEQFTLTVGSATFQVNKNGDVALKGAKIEVTASSDIVITGSKIEEN